MDETIERKTERWFRHLPPDHSFVQVLYAASLARNGGVLEIVGDREASRPASAQAPHREEAVVFDVVTPGGPPPEPRPRPAAAPRERPPALPPPAAFRPPAQRPPPVGEKKPRAPKPAPKTGALQRLMGMFGWSK